MSNINYSEYHFLTNILYNLRSIEYKQDPKQEKDNVRKKQIAWEKTLATPLYFLTFISGNENGVFWVNESVETIAKKLANDNGKSKSNGYKRSNPSQSFSYSRHSIFQCLAKRAYKSSIASH